MTARILFLCFLAISPMSAADPTPADLLRQGLFEEEANRDFDKAAENYRAVIAAHDRQRALAATATYRLGEIARKKNDNEAAASAFRTVIERFPEQQDLARLSRENLAALGMAPAGETPAAALTNDPEDAEIARLKDIARNSPDLIDGAGTDGWRPLHHASKTWTRVLSYLLENGADPNGRTITEQLTPLKIASIHGQLGAVKALLAAGADPNATFNIERCPQGVLPVADQKAKDAKGKWTALDLAILYDRRELARTLIETGTDLKQTGPKPRYYSYELTPLALAIHLKRNDLAQALIDAGSPLGLTGNKDSITPLAIAVRDNPEMVIPLLKAGADPKQSYFKERFTPLRDAAQSNLIETAKVLIEAGADVNATDANGNTPLHTLYTPEMVDFLVSKGADPNAKNTAGLTPLDIFSGFRFEGSNKEMIETYLKHGATVEDPIALLRRCSEENLSVVRDLIVYPREKHPDAILLSVSGSHSFNPEPPPSGRTGRVVVNGNSPQGRPELIVLETRPSPDSPPPTLAEVLCEAFHSRDPLGSIRIVRHDASGGFKSVREWIFVSAAPLPDDWPELEWGDIVEVWIAAVHSDGRSSPSIGDLTKQVPARNVTFRLGGVEIPKTIPGNEMFWLDGNSSQTLRALIPNIGDLADLSHFIIHRKGAPEPITLDFTKPTDTRFRLIDGDTVEVSFNLPELDQKFGEGDFSCLIHLFGDLGYGGYGGTSLAGVLANSLITPPTDFHKILILRRAENWKPEIIDFKAWLDSLPPSDQWKKDTLQSSAPKHNPGDLVILVEDTTANSRESAIEIRKKLLQVDVMMNATRQSRPRVVPPPSQSN